MAENVARQLRDGVAVGEQAPAVMVRDTLDTRAGPALFNHFFSSLTSNVVFRRAQAKGIVAVALGCAPDYYTSASLSHMSASNLGHWLQVVDCYTDPLGWSNAIQADGGSERDSKAIGASSQISICHDISNLTSLLSNILKSGQASIHQESQGKFAVLIDSMSVLLRSHPLPAVTNFLSSLRACEQVSALMWHVHADLHESRIIAGLEYLATTVVFVEPQVQLTSDFKAVNIRCGRVRIRTKKRNGRVREQVEEFHNELGVVKFSPVTLVKDLNPPVITKNSTPKVQFNLELSEKEREDRSKVILPFEHQGDSKEVQIYDGRPDYVGSQFNKLAVSKRATKFAEPQNVGSVDSSGVGEIHYLRDSDDERPDSDEDPDDDLDI